MLVETAEEERGALGRGGVTEPKGQSSFRKRGLQSKARKVKAALIWRLAKKKSAVALVRVVPVDYRE